MYLAARRPAPTQGSRAVRHGNCVILFFCEMFCFWTKKVRQRFGRGSARFGIACFWFGTVRQKGSAVVRQGFGTVRHRICSIFCSNLVFFLRKMQTFRFLFHFVAKKAFFPPKTRKTAKPKPNGETWAGASAKRSRKCKMLKYKVLIAEVPLMQTQTRRC